MDLSQSQISEGCAKLWILLILEHLVKKKWFSWLVIERILESYPYKGKDAANRPKLLSKKMQQKCSRKIIGTFSEVRNLIQSLPQLLYNHIRDPNDNYWQWLLLIRRFLRYILMPQLTDSQIIEMDRTLDILMNVRLNLTRISPEPEEDKDTADINENVEIDTSDDEIEDSEIDEKVSSKYKPTVKWKEHFLSHFSSDIRNLAPLPLLNTDIFEAKE